MPEIANKSMLDTLASEIATLTALPRPSSPTALSKCAIWTHEAVRELSTDPYTVFVIWNGVERTHGPTRLFIQATTYGKTAADAMTRAELIHKKFYATSGDYVGRPRQGWQIFGPATSYTIKAIHEIGMPRSIGSNELGHAVVFDLELSYVRD